MNRKDVSEIRRRFVHDRNNITAIRGCYVSRDGEIISTFAHAIQGIPQEEEEKYLAIFRKTLSGDPGRNLLSVDFTPRQVMEDEHYRLLNRLRDTALTDDESVREFFNRVIASRHAEENTLILLAHDGYDVPYQDANGEKDPERSADVFRYLLCAICPVALSKPTLSYYAAEKEFHSREPDWVVGAPVLGFMFPMFEDRQCNLYGAMMYTKDTGDANAEFVDTVFGTEPTMPADMQKDTFNHILEDALGEECTLAAVQSVQDMVLARNEEAKEEKQSPVPVFSSDDVRRALVDGGVSEQGAEAFGHRFEDELGTNTVLSGSNVAPTRQFEVKTPSVQIRVAPDRSDLVETRIIDGHQYILIRADEEVTVNGVAVRL